MGTWSVSCGSCGHCWKLAGNWSAYEREAVESRPCPVCTAYTLRCPEPEKARSRNRFPTRRPLVGPKSGVLAG